MERASPPFACKCTVGWICRIKTFDGIKPCPCSADSVSTDLCWRHRRRKVNPHLVGDLRHFSADWEKIHSTCACRKSVIPTECKFFERCSGQDGGCKFAACVGSRPGDPLCFRCLNSVTFAGTFPMFRDALNLLEGRETAKIYRLKYISVMLEVHVPPSMVNIILSYKK